MDRLRGSFAYRGHLNNACAVTMQANVDKRGEWLDRK